MTYYENKNIIVRSTTLIDIHLLAKNLREEDIQEIYAVNHETPLDALRRSANESTECMTLELEGKPIAIFGISPAALLGNVACIWLLGSDDINKIKREFLKLTYFSIRYFLKKYPILYNFVDSRNVKSLRWLRRAGAVFQEPIIFGVEKKLFYPFTIKREEKICV